MIITTGDHVKDVKSIKCWSKMSAPIKDKMKIAIGNHDAEFSKIYKQIIAYHNLTTPYYSNDFANIHFISLSTEHPGTLCDNDRQIFPQSLQMESE